MLLTVKEAVTMSFFVLTSLIVTSVHAIASPQETFVSTCVDRCSCEIRDSVAVGRSSVLARLMTVDCSDRNLVDLPANISPFAQSVTFRANAISFLVPNRMHQVDSLLEMDLSYNNLSTISSIGSVSNWSSLLNLDLSYNLIESLPVRVLADFPSLEYLTISNNQLKFLDDGCFQGLSQLKFLSLRENRIFNIRKEIFQGMIKLVSLLLDNNQLMRLTDGVFSPLLSLENVSLAFNELSNMESKTFSGTERLQRVDLSHNSFRFAVAQPFFGVDSVTNIIYDGNPIRSFRRGDFRLLAVRDLSLADMDQLLFIDDWAFSDLHQLEILRLHENRKLAYIHPKAFQRVDKLRILYLHSNQLAAIPSEFASLLPSLEALSIAQNPFHCDCNVRWIKEFLEFSVGDKQQPETRANSTSGRLLLLPDVDRAFCDSPTDKISLSLKSIVLSSLSTECPSVVLPLFNSTVLLEAGEAASFDCRSVGIPLPIIHWILPNGRVVNESSNYSRVRFDSAGSLRIDYTKPSDSGTYTCVALNSKGYDAASAHLSIYNGDAHLILKSVAATFVTVTWNGTESTITTANYMLLYRQQQYPEENKQTDAAGGKRTRLADYEKIQLRPYMRAFTVTSLLPWTVYEFCICCEDVDTIVKLNCLIVQTKGELLSASGMRTVFTDRRPISSWPVSRSSFCSLVLC